MFRPSVSSQDTKFSLRAQQKLNVDRHKLRQQLSGERLMRPSDNPREVYKLMMTSGELGANSSRLDSEAEGAEWANATYLAAEQIKGIVDRVSEIAVSAGNGLSEADCALHAIEVDQLLQQTLGYANERLNGRFLFGGAKVDAPPFKPQITEGKITAVYYKGDQLQSNLQPPQKGSIATNMLGYNSGSAATPGVLIDRKREVDIFGTLIEFRKQLESNQTAYLAGNKTLSKIERYAEHITSILTRSAATANSFTTSITQLETNAEQLKNAVQQLNTANKIEATYALGDLDQQQEITNGLRAKQNQQRARLMDLMA